MSRLATVFHESFALNRPAITQVLEIASDEAQKVNFDSLRESTSLGANYAKAMPRYSVGAGLLEDRSYCLTAFGKFAQQHDPDLNNPSTLWLMHYHLSAPAGPGPAFWHYLVSRQLRQGAGLERASLIEAVRESVLETEGKALVDRSARTLVTVFGGSYTKSDALGRLGILEETDEGYRVLEPDPPNEWVIGYALAHYWDSVWPQFKQVALAELSEFGGFSSLFFLGTYQLNSRLRDLQSRGLLELVQIAPPHQILRLWKSPQDFLEHIYD
ncbi:MAG: DUF4007 family protein [Thermaceae bacterium]|nr:DUF4007 family protein [Thermaceae bacterium]